MKAKLFSLSIIGFILLLVFSSVASAYYDATSSYATEVLLNKPGISYDLNGISQAENVVVDWEDESIGVIGEEEVAVAHETEASSFSMETIAQGGFSGVEEEGCQVIRSQVEWTEVWNNINQGSELPEIDFSQYMLIAAFMGEQPTTGYSIEVSQAFYYQDKLMVTIIKKQPAKDAMVGEALTQPYHIVKVEQSDKEVVFQEAEVRKKIGRIVYRSHYDQRLGVILSQNRLYEDETEYLSVRIQIPAEEVQETRATVEINLFKDIDASSLDIEKAKELGWDIGCSGGEEFYCRGVKGDQSVNILSESQGGVRIIMWINYTTFPLDKQTEEEIAEFWTAINLVESKEAGLLTLENKADVKAEEFTDAHLVPIINPDELDWTEAMKTELLWLRENGVIKGLNDAEIDKIATACQKGTAGYNGRVIFEDGQWLSYSETDYPLIRALEGGGEGDEEDASFLMDLPNGTLEGMPLSGGDTPSPFNYIWVIIGVVVVGAGIGTLLWYRKKATV